MSEDQSPEPAGTFDVQELVLLGIVGREPVHGYEVRRIVEQQFEAFTPVNPGTVYYTLGKLKARGLIASKRKPGNGNLPPKEVFRITPQGERRLRDLLLASLRQPDRPFFAFDVGLFFVHFLGYETLLAAIRERLRRVESYLEVLRRADERAEDWPFNMRAIKERSRRFVEAGRDWYAALEAEVEKMARSRKSPGPETAPLSLDLRFVTQTLASDEAEGA